MIRIKWDTQQLFLISTINQQRISTKDMGFNIQIRLPTDSWMIFRNMNMTTCSKANLIALKKISSKLSEMCSERPINKLHRLIIISTCSLTDSTILTNQVIHYKLVEIKILFLTTNTNLKTRSKFNQIDQTMREEEEVHLQRIWTFKVLIHVSHPQWLSDITRFSRKISVHLLKTSSMSTMVIRIWTIW